jgi:hypothetical protein
VAARRFGALALAAAGLAALLPGPAAAWSTNGHEAVGGIADQLLAGTTTGKRVRAILGGSLLNAAIWADCAKSAKQVNGTWVFDATDRWLPKDCAQFAAEPNNKALIAFVSRNTTSCAVAASHPSCGHKAFHFTDVAVQKTHYDPALPGASQIDLLHAINAAAAVVRSGKATAKSAPPFSISGQREALRLLAHYIGDLHQPLHVGALYLSDAGQPIDPATAAEAAAHDNAGGNKLIAESDNLHHLWDDISPAMKARLLASANVAAARALPAPAGAPDSWVLAWTNESLLAARKAYEPLKFGPKGSAGVKPDEWPATANAPGYPAARAATQADQITKAGARLARLLTELLP